MTETYTGGCACGEIRYSCTGEPLYMGNCHCRDCQRATGSAYFPAMLFKGENFTLKSGEPRWYEVTADSGNAMRAPSARPAARRFSSSTVPDRTTASSMQAAWTTQAVTSRAATSSSPARSLGT